MRVKFNIANCKGNMKIGSQGKKISGKPVPAFRRLKNQQASPYFAAATELTSIVSPLAEPFTVAFAAASLSSLSSVALSAVSNV